MEKEGIGKLGEQMASDFLQEKGYEIIEINFKNPLGRQLGEIDIIAREKKTRELIFVEVKTRDFQKYQDTLPEENITFSKLKRISKIAEFYLKKNQWKDSAFRFDAISVWVDEKRKIARFRHLKNIYL